MGRFKKKIPPEFFVIGISLVIMLLGTACRVTKPTPVSITSTQQMHITSSLSTTPQSTPTPSPSPTQGAIVRGISTTQDEYIRITSNRDSYSISDTVRLKLIVIGDWVTLQGPCNIWFERISGEIWEKVGHCERTFDDEPFSLLQGEEIEFNLTMSSNESEYPYAYTYKLTPGTYRYAVTYWTQNENLLIYSPEFQITEVQVTEDKFLRVSSVERTYSLSDTIQFNLTVKRKNVYFHGPCNMWFERKEDRDWVEVGYCPDTNFTDEPNPVGAGGEIDLTLPMASESEIHYSYHLTPGTYRFVITYWGNHESQLIYSPEFTIVE